MEPLCLGWTEKPNEYLASSPNIDTQTNHTNSNLVEHNEENIDKEIKPSIESDSDVEWMSKDEMDKDLLGITDIRNINQSMVNSMTEDKRDGRVGGLGILWKSSLVDIVKVSGGKNWQACQVKCRLSQMDMELWNIYGPTNYQEKSVFWDDITQLVSASGNKKYIIGGDFNAILDLSKKRGRSKKVTNDILNFR
ncbi:hypothetical protein SUGI_0478440 [Cryptomeria japonica]|nr:hypothetical protein SUGI_0478440 [Cryptomeria japonica]